jgi:hypothetical protein
LDILANKKVLTNKTINIIYAHVFRRERDASKEKDNLDFCALSACLLAKNFSNPLVFYERLIWKINLK